MHNHSATRLSHASAARSSGRAAGFARAGLRCFVVLLLLLACLDSTDLRAQPQQPPVVALPGDAQTVWLDGRVGYFVDADPAGAP